METGIDNSMVIARSAQNQNLLSSATEDNRQPTRTLIAPERSENTDFNTFHGNRYSTQSLSFLGSSRGSNARHGQQPAEKYSQPSGAQQDGNLAGVVLTLPLPLRHWFSDLGL